MSQGNPTDHEAFVYASQYILTGDQTKSFRAAFPNTKAKPEIVWSKASVFHGFGKVQERIKSLNDDQAKKDKEVFDISVEKLKKVLFDVMHQGLDPVDGKAQLSAVVSAVTEVNRMNGNHAAVKSEQTGPDGGPIKTENKVTWNVQPVKAIDKDESDA